MHRRIIAWFLTVVMCLMLSVPSFASATPSDADKSGGTTAGSVLASVSNADMLKGLEQYLSIPLETASDNIMLLSAGDVETVSSTVKLSDVIIYYRYKNTSGKTIDIKGQCNSQGYFSFGTKPSDFSKSDSIIIWLTNCMPPAGKYKASFSFASNTGGHTYSGCTFWSQKTYSNSSDLRSSTPLTDFIQYSGDASGSILIDIGQVRNACYNLYSTDMDFPFGGYVNVRFERLADQSADVDFTTAGGSYSSGDAAADTAQSSAQIAQNTADMSDTLKEIVQTISNQLAALWDQMFNLMHLPQLANDDKNTQRIIDKLGSDLNVEIQNDNDNTETIINGYDRSEMDSANTQLGDSFQSQEEQEQQIMEQISEPLESFSFDNPVVQYLSTFQLFGDFLQQLFVNSGAFKDVINLAFIMTIALMCAGLYRFKGGN